MGKKDFIDTIREILHKAGLENVVTFSGNVNEIGDIMIYRDEKSPEEYFATYGVPLFPISAIRYILYQYGSESERIYFYDHTDLQLQIELKKGVRYVMELGDFGISDVLRVDGGWKSKDEEIEAYLKQYNQKILEGIRVEYLVHAVTDMIIGQEGTITDSETDVIRQTAYRYMKANPEDKAFLLFYTYTALDIFLFAAVTDKTRNMDIFDLGRLMEMIISAGCEDDLLDYIRNEASESCCGAYVTMTVKAMQMMEEIKRKVIKV